MLNICFHSNGSLIYSRVTRFLDPPVSNPHHYMKIDSYMKTGGSVLININIHVMVLKPAHFPSSGC